MTRKEREALLERHQKIVDAIAERLWGKARVASMKGSALSMDAGSNKKWLAKDIADATLAAALIVQKDLNLDEMGKQRETIGKLRKEIALLKTTG